MGIKDETSRLGMARYTIMACEMCMCDPNVVSVMVMVMVSSIDLEIQPDAAVAEAATVAHPVLAIVSARVAVY